MIYVGMNKEGKPYETRGFIKNLQKEDNYVKGHFTTSKLEKDGKKTYSHWEVTFVGDAVEPAKELSEDNLIKLGNFGISNTFDKGTDKNFLNLVVFSFEKVEKKEHE